MFKRLAIKIFGMKSVGWANVYLRENGEKMTGGMLYKTKQEAESRGLCQSASSKYLGTKKLYY